MSTGFIVITGAGGAIGAGLTAHFLAAGRNVIAGALIGLSASWVMIGAGVLIVLVVIVAASSGTVWRLDEVGGGGNGRVSGS